MHALESGIEVEYMQETVENMRKNTQPDVVTCMEMLEHVPDPQSPSTPAPNWLNPAAGVLQR